MAVTASVSDQLREIQEQFTMLKPQVRQVTVTKADLELLIKVLLAYQAEYEEFELWASVTARFSRALRNTNWRVA